MDAETLLGYAGSRAVVSLQWGRITDGCGNTVFLTDERLKLKLQWGRITDGCGNRDSVRNSVGVSVRLQWGRITDGCGNRIRFAEGFGCAAELQWGRITDGCGNLRSSSMRRIAIVCFNGAASLMDAETNQNTNPEHHDGEASMGPHH